MIPVMPPALISSLARRLVTTATETTSPFTGSQEIQDWGGEWWEYQITTTRMTPEEGRRLSAFFAALGGVRGRFVFRDPTATAAAPQTSATGLGVVAGSNQSGNALQTASWLVNTPLFTAGDMISLGADATTRLYQITADVASDDIGTAVLPIVPRLRGSPLNGAAIEVTQPAVLLRLTEPVPVQIGRAGKYQFSFTAREAL